MIKAVVFDLDDTLYPESEYVLSGFCAVENYLGQAGAAKRLEKLFRESREGVFDRFAAEGGGDPRKLHEVYINHFPIIAPYGDVLACLTALKKRGVKLGLITDGRPVQQNNKIDALGLRGFFHAVILSDEFGAEFRKPHLKPFEAVRQALGTDYGEMLYVGDNPAKDFYISALTQMRTARIMRGGIYAGSYYMDIKPNYIINDLSELKKGLLE